MVCRLVTPPPQQLRDTSTTDTAVIRRRRRPATLSYVVGVYDEQDADVFDVSPALCLRIFVAVSDHY